MTIIERLFGRGGKMEQATVESTEGEPTARLAAVALQISAGDGDLVAALEEKEKLERQIQAARIRRERAEAQAFRETRAAQVVELDRRADEIMTGIGTDVPRLLFKLGDLQNLLDEIMVGHPGSNGRSYEEIFGVDHEFAKRLRAAILAENLEWDFGACLPGGKGSRPVPKTFSMKVAPGWQTDIYGRRLGSTTYI